MELAFQDYVNRLSYQPYRWPPDISLAELHSRVSEQGPINPAGAKCPCCNFQSKMEFQGWFSRDIAEDCRGYGTAVPAFFGLLMYYFLTILVVILIHSIYSIWATNYVCEDLVPTDCIQFSYYYIDFNLELAILRQNGDDSIVHTLITLETITFYFLLMINLSSLVYLYFMDKKQKMQTVRQNYAQNAIILGNLPETDHLALAKALNLETKVQIVDIIPIKPLKHLYDLFHKRNIVYFTLMSKYVISRDPKEFQRLNRQLVELDQQYIEEKQRFEDCQFSNMLVFFKRPHQRRAVLDQYQFGHFKKLEFGTKEMLTDWGIIKEEWKLPIYAVTVPDINQIKWENAGQNIRAKLAGRIITFWIALGIISGCLLVLFGPISWSLKTQTNDPSTLSTFQKFIPLIVSLLLFAVSQWFQSYMAKVSKKRFPLSSFQASKFQLLASMTFHILFYIIIPVLFFAIPSSTNQTIKLFIITQQARTFILLQVITNIIDVPYRVWKSRKTSCLSDQRVGFKHYQRELHKIVEFRDFPLEQRIQTMFRIWSFVLFYVFYLPQMVIYMFIALGILYVLQKRNFYLHYALRRAIPLELEKSFLIYFVNFFGIFQCFSYSFNAQYTWMIIAAVTVTCVMLVANIVFWQYAQPKYHKKKERSKDKEEKLLEGESQDSQIQQQIEASVKRVSQEYRRHYELFIDQNKNAQLDQQIDEYIKTLGPTILQSSQEIKQSVKVIIEMPQSDIQGAIS